MNEVTLEVCFACGMPLADGNPCATATLEYTDKPSVDIRLCVDCAIKELGLGVEVDE